jgi:hypothetical protein
MPLTWFLAIASGAIGFTALLALLALGGSDDPPDTERPWRRKGE